MTNPIAASARGTQASESIIIAAIEIHGFRRLQSVRLDFEKDMTVLVGANNSGKTALLSALRLFLRDRKRFSPNDISAQNWKCLRAFGTAWEARAAASIRPSDQATESNETTGPVASDTSWADDLKTLNNAMPSLDLWLDVPPGHFHHVAQLIPTLDWKGGRLGVRLRLEPAADVAALQSLAQAYTQARTIAQKAGETDSDAKDRAWPTDLLDYWLRHPEHLGSVATYKLDPSKLLDATDTFEARPQPLAPNAPRCKDGLLQKLIRLDVVPAQRGLGWEEADGNGDRESQRPGLFSQQLVKLAHRRFDHTPFEHEGQGAMLAAVAKAQTGLDKAIATSLADVTEKVRTLGYPGLHDPQELVFRTRVQTSDLLKHNTAVRYSISDEAGANLHLPEHGIGLGYQNLQALTHELYAFRDERMGGLGKGPIAAPAPVHLVLVEEPEAHLHVQAQRVFVKRAYDLLKPDASEAGLSSQLVVSTHSSHVAHAISFSQIRYVRRATARGVGAVPSSAVVSLRGAFGDDKETQRFAERYLRIQHSDLLFADGAIFVEGTAERLLVPQFIERRHKGLASRCISYLEVGGSHAHRLQPLVERLGLPTLIITDLDPASESEDVEGKRRPPRKAPVGTGDGLLTTNPTLEKWHPKMKSIVDLLELDDTDKETNLGTWPDVKVRVAYQVPGDADAPCGATFEDAFVLENMLQFLGFDECQGPLKAVQVAVNACTSRIDLASRLHTILSKDFDKARFALDLLSLEESDAESIDCPRYIDEGLAWLERQLTPRSNHPVAPPKARAS